MASCRLELVITSKHLYAFHMVKDVGILAIMRETRYHDSGRVWGSSCPNPTPCISTPVVFIESSACSLFNQGGCITSSVT